MKIRTASIKETGEELSQSDWARFDAAVAEEKAKRGAPEPGGDQPRTDATDTVATGPERSGTSEVQ